MTRFIPIRPGSRCACLGAAREYNALGVAPNDGQAGAEGTKDQEPRQADISLAAPIMLGATMLLAHGLPVWPRLAAQLAGDGANQRPESKKNSWQLFAHARGGQHQPDSGGRSADHPGGLHQVKIRKARPLSSG